VAHVVSWTEAGDWGEPALCRVESVIGGRRERLSRRRRSSYAARGTEATSGRAHDGQLPVTLSIVGNGGISILLGQAG
jgi:hypothetical protein